MACGPRVRPAGRRPYGVGGPVWSYTAPSVSSRADPYDGPNRRRVQRIMCRVAARYRSGKVWHPATAVDLSEGGCRLRLGEDLERGTSVLLRFEPPDRGEAPRVCLEVEASVVWTRHEGLSYQAGLHFSEPPPGLEALLEAIR